MFERGEVGCGRFGGVSPVLEEPVEQFAGFDSGGKLTVIFGVGCARRDDAAAYAPLAQVVGGAQRFIGDLVVAPLGRVDEIEGHVPGQEREFGG